MKPTRGIWIALGVVLMGLYGYIALWLVLAMFR